MDYGTLAPEESGSILTVSTTTMSTAGTALTTWEEFLHLPDPADGALLELRDGEVVRVPPPRAIHVYIQSVLTEWLTLKAQGQGRATNEFPYRPAANLQFWRADVAYLPAEDWPAMYAKDYPVYSPPLIVEVLSPSNTAAEIARRRIAAFSGGTREFWVVDPDHRTIEVSMPGAATRVYRAGDSVPVSVIPGALFPVQTLFRD